jgi:hypothetical protein
MGPDVFHELETVVVTRDLDSYALKQGDMGTVVHCYADRAAFEVEFVTGDGKTVALVTLGCADIRMMAPPEILHVRQLAG